MLVGHLGPGLLAAVEAGALNILGAGERTHRCDERRGQQGEKSFHEYFELV
jgi:hypothetical protein